MIKSLVAGIWAITVLSGSIYFFGNQSADPAKESEMTGLHLSDLEHIKLDPMSVAIIRKNEVQGYIIVEAAFSVLGSKLEDLAMPIKILLQNSINNAIFNNPAIDFNRLEKFDIAEFQASLTQEINQKLGNDLIHEVLIQRIDFISSEDIRDKKLRRG